MSGKSCNPDWRGDYRLSHLQKRKKRNSNQGTTWHSGGRVEWFEFPERHPEKKKQIYFGGIRHSLLRLKNKD